MRTREKHRNAVMAATEGALLVLASASHAHDLPLREGQS